MREGKSIGSFLIVSAALVIVLAGIKTASVIIVPFLLSLFIAIIFSPLFNWLNEKGLHDTLSLFVVVGIFIGLIAIVGILVGSSAHDFNANLPQYEANLTAQLSGFFDILGSYGISVPKEELLAMFGPKVIMKYMAGTLKSFGSVITNGMVVLLTVIFLLLETAQFSQKFKEIDGEKRLHIHISEIGSKIKQYMVLKTIISAVTGFLVYLILLIIGIDYPVLWGVAAFLLNFIPNIGSLMAAVPAVLLAQIQFGFFFAMAVMTVYIIINTVIGSIIEPKVMGNGLGLSTLIVFLSLIFWGWLLGPVGMLLSIPLTIMVKIVLAANPRTEWMAVMLGEGKNA